MFNSAIANVTQNRSFTVCLCLSEMLNSVSYVYADYFVIVQLALKLSALDAHACFETCSPSENGCISIDVGAQSTLRRHKVFARKICIKNQPNARILHDSCAKNYQNTRICMICDRKLYKNSRILHDFCPQNARILHNNCP